MAGSVPNIMRSRTPGNNIVYPNGINNTSHEIKGWTSVGGVGVCTFDGHQAWKRTEPEGAVRDCRMALESLGRS
ncbi:hypothetical protein Y032_0019g3870 [Ancylostoma ceylanicum]|uniref:Uncharacterized protein n=1 Tax=Ancylostoma ceylanicum TaxID=53326 RepID=A0A016V471_9BILA|nr:hypothetical protein Y032_0019g3870 [Ancylostoma ceylanicum]